MQTANDVLRIAVCDDQPTDREMIEHMTRETLKLERIECVITTFESGVELMASIRGGAEFQLLLLDVMMKELDGLELAAMLREQGDQTAIIYISAYHEKALSGYEVSAARFLAKPIQPEKLREALLYCVSVLQKNRSVLISTTEGQRRIAVEDILYAETWGRGVRITCADGAVESSMSISRLAAMLPEQFIFCHRAFLVNLAHVRSLRYIEMDMDNGTTLTVSKHRYAEVKNQYMNYLGD